MASTVTLPTHRSVRVQALLGLLVANVFWGLSFPLIKALVLLHEAILPNSGTWFITSMVLAPRFVLATVVVLVWQALRRRGLGCTRGEWEQGAVIGLFAVAGMIFQSDGLQFTAASTSAFLTQLYAILIPLYVAWRTGVRPGRIIWISAGLVLAGVAILGRLDWRDLKLGRGEWETLLASLFFMGQILWLEKPKYATNRPENVTLVMFATESVVLLAAVGLTMPSVDAVAALSGTWLIFTGVLTLLCTVGAYTLMNTWQPKISATEAGLIYCIEPVFGSIMALFLPAWFSVWAVITYPNELATWTLVVGGGLITLANLLVQLRKN
ncbi:MAG TPA: DMT family transporter [Opitutaceae bacterium]|nr:DMT family transporter [Opitutaceae bacterium]